MDDLSLKAADLARARFIGAMETARGWVGFKDTWADLLEANLAGVFASHSHYVCRSNYIYCAERAAASYADARSIRDNWMDGWYHL